jgi:hypothetical protein
MFWGWGGGFGFGFGFRRTIGCIALVVGILLMLCSTPFVLWCSFIGLGLIILGVTLIRRGFF